MFELVFHPEARKELIALEAVMKGQVSFALDKLESQGNQLRYPHTSPIRDGLFELRIGKKDIARTFFTFAKGRRIYILRTFVKKTPRTPLSEIQLAFKRLEEMKHES